MFGYTIIKKSNLKELHDLLLKREAVAERLGDIVTAQKQELQRLTGIITSDTAKMDAVKTELAKIKYQLEVADKAYDALVTEKEEADKALEQCQAKAKAKAKTPRKNLKNKTNGE